MSYFWWVLLIGLAFIATVWAVGKLIVSLCRGAINESIGRHLGW